MSPTLLAADCIFSENVSYQLRKPRRGGIVVFTTEGISGVSSDPSHPAPVYIHRIIGIPGDTLELRYGTLLVNGKEDFALRGRKIAPGRTYLTPSLPVQVLPDSYFLSGDNTEHSFDSRYWGFLPEKNLGGRAVFRYLRATRLGPLQ